MKAMSLLSVLVVVGSSLPPNLPFVRCLLSSVIVVGSSVLMSISTLLFALIARNFSRLVDERRKLIVRPSPSVAIAVTELFNSVLIRAYSVKLGATRPE